MKLYFDSGFPLKENLYGCYSENAKQLLRRLTTNRELNRFSDFNKRFKISWGMEVQFNDELSIKNETTRDCYRLMLKISDLWFAFEHLVDVASEKVPRKPNKSKIDFFHESTNSQVLFPSITAHVNQLLKDNVLHLTAWRRELYRFIPYIKNNTTGGTKTTIGEIHDLIHERQNFEERHIFALAYGIRNIYVHQGVSAALGTDNYNVKKALYSVLHDALILYSLTLGNAYCQRKLLDYEPDSGE